MYNKILFPTFEYTAIMPENRDWLPIAFSESKCGFYLFPD